MPPPTISPTTCEGASDHLPAGGVRHPGDARRKGLARRIRPAGSLARYEDRVGDNHRHLVCRNCGVTVDIDSAVGEAPCLTADDDHGSRRPRSSTGGIAPVAAFRPPARTERAGTERVERHARHGPCCLIGECYPLASERSYPRLSGRHRRSGTTRSRLGVVLQRSPGSTRSGSVPFRPLRPTGSMGLEPRRSRSSSPEDQREELLRSLGRARSAHGCGSPVPSVRDRPPRERRRRSATVGDGSAGRAIRASRQPEKPQAEQHDQDPTFGRDPATRPQLRTSPAAAEGGPRVRGVLPRARSAWTVRM